MQILISLIPLLVMFALIAAYTKLAARIFSRTSLSWRNSFLFALLIGGLSIAGRGASIVFDYSLPLALGLFVGLSINLLLGGWFLGTHATDTQGQSLGWGRGMVLSGIMFGLLSATGVALMGVIHVLMPLTQS